MDTEKNHPRQPSSTWIWLSVDGTRWRIKYTEDGTWSCPIGTGGKRIGSWKSGLPSTLGIWPGPKIQG